MKSKTKTERLSVFSTYRDVFKGDNARVRKRKAIRNIVLKHWSSRQNATNKSEINKVIPVLKALLADRVFESEELARREFPKLLLESYIIRDRVANAVTKISEETEAGSEMPTKIEQEETDSDAAKSMIGDVLPGMAPWCPFQAKMNKKSYISCV